MHPPGGVDEVEGPEPLLAVQPRQECLRERILKSDRPNVMVHLQHARDDELAQAAVGVVEQPVSLSQVAA
jgi:hypothetical protein